MTPDEELCREWQQGAVGALEALVRCHHAPLLAHLVRLTGNPALAEDLCQGRRRGYSRTRREESGHSSWFRRSSSGCGRRSA
jgi:hypothetical protein